VVARVFASCFPQVELENAQIWYDVKKTIWYEFKKTIWYEFKEDIVSGFEN
jgi:hypothetical protein